MEQEQWLLLKMLFLLVYNLKIVIQWGINFWWGKNKNLVRSGGGGGWFSRWDMSKFLAGGGDLPPPPSRENPVLITFAPESFWILFYIAKVILKLYLDGKLQVTLAYYLYYKSDFSYCQIFWLLKC